MSGWYFWFWGVFYSVADQKVLNATALFWGCPESVSAPGRQDRKLRDCLAVSIASSPLFQLSP